MKVADIMSRNIKTVNLDSLLTSAARVMTDHDIGCLPVVKGEEIFGVVTDRDMIVRGVASGKNPDETTVGQVMTWPVEFVSEDADLEEAIHLMDKRKIRRIP